MSAPGSPGTAIASSIFSASYGIAQGMSLALASFPMRCVGLLPGTHPRSRYIKWRIGSLSIAGARHAGSVGIPHRQPRIRPFGEPRRRRRPRSKNRRWRSGAVRFLVRPLVATALATRTSGSERCRLARRGSGVVPGRRGSAWGVSVARGRQQHEVKRPQRTDRVRAAWCTRTTFAERPLDSQTKEESKCESDF